jgi:hypothetical protein
MNLRDSTLSGLPARSSDHLWRAAAAVVRAFTGNTNVEGALARMYPEDKVAPLLLRTASTPARLTDPAWAGPLAAYSVSQAVEEMVALSAVGKLISAGALRVELGHFASVAVPGRATTAAAAGLWTTEGGAKPVRQFNLSSGKLTPHKLAVITALTREITEASNIEDMLRTLITEATGLALDAAIFSTAPRGIFNGLTPLTPSTGTTGAFDAVGQDLGTLVGDIASRGGGSNVVFVASPAQATSIRFYSPGGTLELATAPSAGIAPASVAAIEAPSFAISIGVPEFSVSRVAALHMEDTTPADIVAGTPSTPVKSMFQIDAIALKMEIWADWCMRAPHAAFMSPVTWL